MDERSSIDNVDVFSRIDCVIAGLLTEILGVSLLKNLLLGGGILTILLIGWELWSFESNATAKCKESIAKNFAD